jgi:hypothetical protein
MRIIVTPPKADEMNQSLDPPGLVTPDGMRHVQGAGDFVFHGLVAGVGLACLPEARQRYRPHLGGLLMLLFRRRLAHTTLKSDLGTTGNPDEKFF